MITLSKSGSTVTFTFDENSGYLQNGTIDVPVNSLSLIIDESDMATFRKAASNDIFISARYEEFGMSKADLEAWYKANMVSSGGGGGGGVTPSEVQSMIDSSISGKADADDVYTIEEVDDAISAATDDMATETWVGAQGYITGVDLSNYATLDNVAEAVSGKADTTAVTEAISAATDDMATKTWVGEQGYLTEHQSLSAYSTTEEVNSAITEATSGKVDTSTYNTYTANTATEIGNKLAVSDFNSYSGVVDTAINSKASESDLSALTDVVSAHTANTDIHVTTAQTAAWNAKSDFSGSYNDLTDKPTIPTVPTSNTAFTNDAGYITEDAISGKADSSAVTEEISAAVSGKVDTSTFNTYSGSVETALSGKQDTLSAGTGIEISGNVISAEGGGGGMTEDDELLLATALTDLNDRKIDASEVKSNYQKKGDYVTTSTLNTRLADYETALDEQNVEEVAAYALNDLNQRFGGLKLIKITESEYAALTTKDENTLYIVVADPS